MKTEYGVRAALELAGNAGRGALQSGEIARRQGIPGPFLDQVLMTLRRAGLVSSTRGRSRQEDGAGAGDSQVLAQVTERAEQAAREVFASHTLADCLRLRRAESRVFHGIFHSAPANRKDA